VIHLGEELYLYGGSSGAYLLGTACDDSGIRRRQTQVWIDNRPIHPMKVVEEAQGSSKPRDSLFHWAGPTDRKHGKCEEIYFGRRIDEGRHTGRIRAVDTVGLSGEATKSFDLFLAPLIREFKSHPVSLQRAGGPAFSALITDGGRDLRKQGLVLKIDGKSIGRDRIFYDPASGYFSVDGPLDLSEGRHEALLTATDDHGHRAEQRLSFTPGETVTLTASGSGQVRLKEVVLWELQDHNGDGKANPGELVRLFVTVENSGAIALEGVVGTLYSEQDLIKVTENRVTYGRLGAGETPLPLKGYDIRIQKDILKTTSSDPLHAHFRLEATSRDGSKWQLPFTLPIYLPIFPASSVTVKLNRLPRTSQSKRITVTGKASSAGSIIDRVVVYVNGKSFEAKWDASENRFSAKVSLHKGSNLIEARATDKAGAQGIAMAFTALVSPFVPPEIRISEPPNGASYNCNRPYLRGWFRTGSSGFSAIEARITRPDGLVVNIPVTVEGGEGTAYTFRSNQRLSPGDGSNQVQVVVTTTEGRRAVSLVTFSYACGGGEG
jgi:hypothetical protein